MSAILMSVNPPYAEMIVSGQKPMEFRNKVIKDVYSDSDCPPTVYIYETKNKGGCGMVIGKATIVKIFKLQQKDDEYNVKNRNDSLVWLYYDWCFKNNIKPNPKEGWFTSTRFTEYYEKIGWGRNYALALDLIARFDTPIPLSSFSTGKSVITHPPQNMCSCICQACKV